MILPKNDNLNFKIKILKFLGIQAYYTVRIIQYSIYGGENVVSAKISLGVDGIMSVNLGLRCRPFDGQTSFYDLSNFQNFERIWTIRIPNPNSVKSWKFSFQWNNSRLVCFTKYFHQGKILLLESWRKYSKGRSSSEFGYQQGLRYSRTGFRPIIW